MAKTFVLAAGILAFMMTSSSHATNACSLDVDVTNSPAWSGKDGRGYDVFDSEAYFQPITFRVQAVGSGCGFFATAAASGSLSSEGLLTGPSEALRFMVYRDTTGTQPLQGVSLATVADVLPGVLEKDGDSSTFQIAYGIRAGQVVGPGVYTGQITIAAYEGELGSGRLLAQRVVPLTAVVPSIAETSFSEGKFDPNYGIYSLNFNTMYQGEKKGVTIRTRSNGGYRVLARSLNKGVMRHVDAADPSAVPYRMTVDGQPISLGEHDIQAAQSREATDSLGKTHRVDFEIGSIAGAGAGDYWDIVSITIISLR